MRYKFLLKISKVKEKKQKQNDNISLLQMKKLGWEEHPEKTSCLISVGSYFRVNLSNIKKEEVNLCNSKALAEGK